MPQTQEKALTHLTNTAVEKVSTAILLKEVEQYPYFAPARFFLASRSLSDKSNDADKLIQKANLYFTNPLWLEFQLSKPVFKKSQPIHSPETKKSNLSNDLAVPTVEAVKAMMRNIDHSGKTTEEEEEPLPEGAENDVAMDEVTADSKISNILSEQLADFRKPLEADAKLDIENEKQRLITIDYFASQGIKIDLTAIPQDKLTRNLLKFTDWLKQIKQVSPTELAANLEMEKEVAKTALESNQTREIETETMAEVLAKQGQTDKAIQLLIKLSFLNPEKSSYFAAKIEQLKGI